MIRSRTIRTLDYEQGDLAVFLDETGNPKLNEKQRVFGVGGCATIGQDYTDYIKPYWRRIKTDIFKLPPEKEFHACDHLGLANEQQIDAIADFLRDGRIKKISVIVSHETQIDPSSSLLDSVLRSVENTVLQLVPKTFASDRWIFEHSDDLSRLTIMAMMEHAWNYFHIKGTSGKSFGLSFLSKKSAEPGVEIADMIMYVVGLYSRNAPNFKSSYNKIMAASFDNRSIGISDRISHVIAPVRYKIQADGTLQVVDPIPLTIIYPKTGARAERRRKLIL